MVNVNVIVQWWLLDSVTNISNMTVEGNPVETLKFYIMFRGKEAVSDDVYVVI
ncbi:unnamed protein product [Meloidogyne enterolobii]|uniref:Uncharacterized protein n=1 Tax=Meloidogyne enterolobii TaxID=390850 RepID=A0ACB0ZAS9_MELEN